MGKKGGASSSSTSGGNFPFDMDPSHISKNSKVIFIPFTSEKICSRSEIDLLYENIQREENQYTLARNYVFDPQYAAHYFHEIYKRNPNGKKAIRKMIQIGTIDALIKGKYHVALSAATASSGTTATSAAAATTASSSSQQSTTAKKKEKKQKQQRPAAKKKAQTDEQAEEEQVETAVAEEEPTSSKNYTTVLLDKKQIIKSVQETKYYTEDQIPKSYLNGGTTTGTTSSSAGAGSGSNVTVIQIVEGDCLEVGIHLKQKEGLNPCVLIMASTSHPGGGYRSASAAQEENLCRRSNLFMCLEDPYQMDPSRKWSYPLPEFGGIYVKNCIILRNGEFVASAAAPTAKEASSAAPAPASPPPPRGIFGFLPKPIELSMVAVSAYKYPPVEVHERKQQSAIIHEWKLCPKTTQRMKKKIQVILGIAHANGHNAVVLSAFGCGAYNNPPTHVAQLFKEVIESAPFKNQFKKIVFAIYNDVNAMKSTVGVEQISTTTTTNSSSLEAEAQVEGVEEEEEEEEIDYHHGSKGGSKKQQQHKKAKVQQQQQPFNAEGNVKPFARVFNTTAIPIHQFLQQQ